MNTVTRAFLQAPKGTLEAMAGTCLPDHELRHVDVKQDDSSGAVVVVLHFAKQGVVSVTVNDQDLVYVSANESRRDSPSLARA